MKYFVAMCLLAVPLAISVAPTFAEASVRGDHFRCHFVKKAVWKHGHRRSKWVRVCHKRPRMASNHRRHR